MRAIQTALTLLIVFHSADHAVAELKSNALITDNLIFQRGAKTSVWGTTNSDADVMVKFAEQTVVAKPAGGAWQAEFAPLEASATPRDLLITQGNQSITRKNVLVGDVWICGGQSNMEWSVNQSRGRDEALATAANSQLRLFTVYRGGGGSAEPRTDVAGQWDEASAQSAKDFSAVGYYFGRDLQRAVDVPIGLISSNVGGTTAERWLSKSALESNAAIKAMTAPQGKHDLYNSMIAPLAPFAIKGAVWYQGEQNWDRPYHYRHLLSALIGSWRETFRNPEMPFYIVELAPWSEIKKEPVDQEWPVLRESMQWVAKQVPNTATVSIVDVGDWQDIHPTQKQPVGERLARVARANTYGEKIIANGPQFADFQVSGHQAIIKFKNVAKGMVAKGGGELTGFTIAGQDRKFYNAVANIDGETVVVSSEHVAAPKAVRFGWANYPVVNLFNSEDLPAHPFRTDDWPVVRQGAK